MKTKLLFTLGVSLILGGISLQAERGVYPVEVEFANPESFTDFQLYGWNDPRSLEALKSEFRTEIGKLAARYLRHGEFVTITIRDIDMAGDYEFWHGPGWHDTRILRDRYPPRVDFDYIVKDSRGNTIADGSEKLRDLAYLFGVSTPDRQWKNLYYETRLFQDWFRRNFG